MAKAFYVGVGGVARKVKQPYIGVNSVARKVKKGYIGVNGVARCCFAGYAWNKYNVTTAYATNMRINGVKASILRIYFPSVLYSGECDYVGYGSDGNTPIHNSSTNTFTFTNTGFLGSYPADGSRRKTIPLAVPAVYTCNVYPIYSIGSFSSETQVVTISSFTTRDASNSIFWTKERGDSTLLYMMTAEPYETYGSYISTVTSSDPNTYPTNGKHTDGYWYIKQ